MKNILLIGVGLTGTAVINHLQNRMTELGNMGDNHIETILFDLDSSRAEKMEKVTYIHLAEPVTIETVCKRLGEEAIQEWFSVEDKIIKSERLLFDDKNWRKKWELAFLNAMNHQENQKKISAVIERMISKELQISFEIYIVSSICDGVGSGASVPIALYFKKIISKKMGRYPNVKVLFACPDIFLDDIPLEERGRAYANSYATLREINAMTMVAQGNNKTRIRDGEQKDLIHIKLGSSEDKEPILGTLFDSDDETYWIPDAAPFNKVYMVDRIPGINSIESHFSVMANTLYSTICTDLGLETDSIAANEDLMLSETKNNNVLYSAISVSQIRFPYFQIDRLLACEKALKYLELKDWISVRDETKKRIKKEDEYHKESSRKYTASPIDYSSFWLEALETLQKSNQISLFLLDEFNSEKFQKKMEGYFQLLDNQFKSLMSDEDDKKFWEDGKVFTLDDLMNAKNFTEKFAEYRKNAISYLKSYVQNLVQRIPRQLVDIKNQIYISSDKQLYNQSSVSLFDLILKGEREKEYIHPIASMMRLNMLLLEIKSKLNIIADNEKKEGVKTWEDNLDEEQINTYISDCFVPVTRKEIGAHFYRHSIYEKTEISDGKVRLFEFDPKGKSIYDLPTECKFLEGDIHKTTANIKQRMIDKLKKKSLEYLESTVESLLNEYKTFFSNYRDFYACVEKKKKRAQEVFEESNNAILNVYSDDSALNEIRSQVLDTMDLDSFASKKIISKGIWEIITRNEYERRTKGGCNYKVRDGMIQKVCEDFVSSIETEISNSAIFSSFERMNVIEAFLKERKSEEELKQIFSHKMLTATKLSQSSMVIDMSAEKENVLRPIQNISIMMSMNTARFIYRNAHFFDLSSIPEADEKHCFFVAANAFVRRYVEASNVSAIVSPKFPDYFFNIVGETRNIAPERLGKYEELNVDGICYKNYRQLCEEYYKKKAAGEFGADFYNPHLGNNMDFSYNVPYLNPEKKHEENRLISKILFYLIMKNRLYLDTSFPNEKPSVQLLTSKEEAENLHRIVDVSNASQEKFVKIQTSDEQPITENNISELFEWIRFNYWYLKKYLDLYEVEMLNRLEKMPIIVGENENENQDISKQLASADSFVRIIKKGFFKEKKKGDFNKDTSHKNLLLRPGMSGFEFAYVVWTTERKRGGNNAYSFLRVICEELERIVAWFVSKEELFENYQKMLQELQNRVLPQEKKHSRANMSGADTVFDNQKLLDEMVVRSWVINSKIFTIKEE